MDRADENPQDSKKLLESKLLIHRKEMRKSQNESLFNARRFNFAFQESKNNFENNDTLKNAMEELIEIIRIHIKNVSSQDFASNIKKMRVLACSQKSALDKLIESNILVELNKILDVNSLKTEDLLNDLVVIIINLTCLETEKMMIFKKEKTLDKLITIINETNDQVHKALIENCLWCLSNLLEISPENKNDIIEKGILEKAKKSYQISKNMESLKNLTLIIFQLTKSRPIPSFDKLEECASFCIEILRNFHENEILYPAILFLANNLLFAEQKPPKIAIEYYIKGGVIAIIRKHLSDTNTPILLYSPLLQIIGMLTHGGDEETETIVTKFAPIYIKLMECSSIKVRHLVFWNLSNIFSSKKEHCTILFNYEDLMLKLMQRLIIDESIVQKEILYCIINILYHCNYKQIHYLIDNNLVKILLNLLVERNEGQIVILIIHCFDSLLNFFDAIKREKEENVIVQLIENNNGAIIFENLQKHPDEAVYKKLEEFIRRHFEQAE